MPPSLLGSGAPLTAALGELIAGAGEEEADMGRLQVTLVSKNQEREKTPNLLSEAKCI